MRKRERRPEDEDMRLVSSRHIEDDDAELLEMRRKALESLMKRTDKELLKKEKVQPPAERRIVETEVKEPEPTFIVTMDGIDDNYFSGAAKAKNKEEKPKLKSLARRKAESFVSDSKASSDAELELHADVSFDEPTQKSVKVKEKKAKKQKKEKRAEKKAKKQKKEKR